MKVIVCMYKNMRKIIECILIWVLLVTWIGGVTSFYQAVMQKWEQSNVITTVN